MNRLKLWWWEETREQGNRLGHNTEFTFVSITLPLFHLLLHQRGRSNITCGSGDEDKQCLFLANIQGANLQAHDVIFLSIIQLRESVF